MHFPLPTTSVTSVTSDMSAPLLPEPVRGNRVRQKQVCCCSQLFCDIFHAGCSCLWCIFTIIIIVSHIFSANEGTVFDHMVEDIVEKAPNKTIAEGVNEVKYDFKHVDDTDFYVLETVGFTWFILLCGACMYCYTSNASVTEVVSRITNTLQYNNEEHPKQLDTNNVEHRLALDAKDTEHRLAFDAKDTEHRLALTAMDTNHLKELDAKDTEHQAILDAKDTEHRLALAAKDTEHRLALAAMDTNHLEELDAKNAIIADLKEKNLEEVVAADDSSDSSDSSDYSEPDHEPEPEPEPELERKPVRYFM